MEDKYRIGELVKALGINRETLRFYEREGILSPARSANKYRYYSYDDYRLLLDVLAFRQDEISLADTKRILLGDGQEDNEQTFRRLVEERREMVRFHQGVLERLEAGMSLYERVEEGLGHCSIKSLEKHLRVSQSDALYQSELLDHTFLFEHHQLGDNELELLDKQLCVPASAIEAFGDASKWDEEDVLELQYCVYSVVSSPTRTLSLSTIRPILDWAFQHEKRIGQEFYGKYLLVNKGLFFMEIYMPLLDGV